MVNLLYFPSETLHKYKTTIQYPRMSWLDWGCVLGLPWSWAVPSGLDPICNIASTLDLVLLPSSSGSFFVHLQAADSRIRVWPVSRGHPVPVVSCFSGVSCPLILWGIPPLCWSLLLRSRVYLPRLVYSFPCVVPAGFLGLCCRITWQLYASFWHTQFHSFCMCFLCSYVYSSPSFSIMNSSILSSWHFFVSMLIIVFSIFKSN